MAGLEGPTSHQPFVTPAHRHGPRSVAELDGSLDRQEVTRVSGSNHDRHQQPVPRLLRQHAGSRRGDTGGRRFLSKTRRLILVWCRAGETYDVENLASRCGDPYWRRSWCPTRSAAAATGCPTPSGWDSPISSLGNVSPSWPREPPTVGEAVGDPHLPISPDHAIVSGGRNRASAACRPRLASAGPRTRFTGFTEDHRPSRVNPTGGRRERVMAVGPSSGGRKGPGR